MVWCILDQLVSSEQGDHHREAPQVGVVMANWAAHNKHDAPSQEGVQDLLGHMLVQIGGADPLQVGHHLLQCQALLYCGSINVFDNWITDTSLAATTCCIAGKYQTVV